MGESLMCHNIIFTVNQTVFSEHLSFHVMSRFLAKTMKFQCLNKNKINK